MSENLDTPPVPTENTTPANSPHPQKNQNQNRPGRKAGQGKRTNYYEEQRVKYEKYLHGNEFLTIPEVLEAVNAEVISLLTTDVKSRQLIGVSRENMKEVLKSLKIMPKMLARSSNSMWDLLSSKQEAKQLAGSILSTYSLQLQTEYMRTRNTNITIHGVPVDISENRIGAFFAKFSQVDKVSAVRSKSGIATRDIILQVVLTRQSFQDIPNILTCRFKKILVVVEGRRPCCWACGAVGHMAKAWPGKKVERPTKSTASSSSRSRSSKRKGSPQGA